jgi:WD40 repeat protein
MDVTKGVFEEVYRHPFADGGGGNGRSTSARDGWVQCAELDASRGVVYVGESGGGVTAADTRTGKQLWHEELHGKKVNSVGAHPTASHYLLTAGLDRTVKLWDMRCFGKKTGSGVEAVAVMPELLSVNSAAWSPTGKYVITAAQSNYCRLYTDVHLGQAQGRVDEDTRHLASTHDCRHDNKTGRYLAVFKPEWDPKVEHSFVVGSMMRPRQVEVYSVAQRQGQAMCVRTMCLQSPDWLGSVCSRNAFHPTQDVVVCANSSGRLHVFR